LTEILSPSGLKRQHLSGEPNALSAMRWAEKELAGR